MYPAELAYNNFSVILRYGTTQSPIPFLFILGQPALEYNHIERFAKGIDAYNPFADAINSVQGGKVEEHACHIQRERSFNDPIQSVRLVGTAVDYTATNNLLQVDTTISAGGHVKYRSPTMKVQQTLPWQTRARGVRCSYPSTLALYSCPFDTERQCSIARRVVRSNRSFQPRSH
jgi:hypothetical protein